MAEVIKSIQERGALMATNERHSGGLCDKCGKPVPLTNDAVWIQFLATGDWGLVTTDPRHFLPTADCPGSPSRAQYIEGQPRDPRYRYHPEDEAKWRQAYAEALSRGENN